MTSERIEEYQVIVVNGAAELSKQVNTKIAEGWQPFGNVVTNPNGQWGQAIVKYKALVRRPLTEPLSVTKRDG